MDTARALAGEVVSSGQCVLAGVQASVCAKRLFASSIPPCSHVSYTHYPLSRTLNFAPHSRLGTVNRVLGALPIPQHPHRNVPRRRVSPHPTLAPAQPPIPPP